MGKATILQNKGKGLYFVRVHFENRIVTIRKDYLAGELLKVTDAYIEASNARAAAEADFNFLVGWLDAYFSTHTPAQYLEDMDAINAAHTDIAYARTRLDVAVRAERLVRLKQKAMELEVNYLKKYCPDYIDTYAWCVAYNEGLTGDVATIEIDYHIKRDIYTNQITNHSVAGSGTDAMMDKSGFWLFDGAGTIDSILQHPLSSSSHAVWYNVCMLPAAQKWKARFRIGILESIDYDNNKCSLAIYGGYNVDRFNSKLIDWEPIVPESSSSNAQQNRYRGVTISYMGSGAETFLVGDTVIADFHNGASDPTVIGYYDNPRQGAKVVVPCGAYGGEVSGSGVYTAVMQLKFMFSGSSSSWVYSQTSYTNGGSCSYSANTTKTLAGLPGSSWIDSSIAYSRTYTETGTAAGRTVVSDGTGSSTVTIATYVNSTLLHTLIMAQSMSGTRSIAPRSYSNTGSRVTYVLHSMIITPVSVIYEITKEETTYTGSYSGGNLISRNRKTAHYKLKYSVAGGEIVLDLDDNPSSIAALTIETNDSYTDGYSYMDNGHDFTTDQGPTTTYTQTFDGLAVLGHEFVNYVPV